MESLVTVVGHAFSLSLSQFDNGYVDHPLNTDHAWVESSVWKIQFKDWRVPEMKASQYAIAAGLLRE